MKGMLAIETATDACSVAVWRDGAIQECHELVPRQHNQRLFGMLRELLPAGRLGDAGIEAVAYGCGPGSFTGLRVAASAVQGLCFSAGIPAIPVSTLACQVQVAIRSGMLEEGATAVSLLDARIGEMYVAGYRVENGIPVEIAAPQAVRPQDYRGEELPEELIAIGGGEELQLNLATEFRARLSRSAPEVLPRARDLVPLALAAAKAGATQSAMAVQPVYVRDEISWKKIAEQGKQ